VDWKDATSKLTELYVIGSSQEPLRQREKKLGCTGVLVAHLAPMQGSLSQSESSCRLHGASDTRTWYDRAMPEISRNKPITRVETLGGTRLRLTFGCDESREVDITQLVPFDGVFEALQDPAFFRRVSVNEGLGTIVWPNGPDLCPDVLYEHSR